MKMRKHILSSLAILTLLLSGQLLLAQDKVVFTGTAPRVVEVGEYFRLSYSLTAKGENFVGPNLSDFSFSGPMVSTNMSTQIVNGKATRSTTYTYTYTLQAAKEGKFKISAAKVKVGKKNHVSNEVSIEVVKANPSRNQPAANTRTQSRQNVNSISNDDLFTKVILDKTSVYKGEQILATIKVYTRVNLARFGEIKIPSFQGFWTQDIKTSEQISLERENYKGKIYNVGVIKKSILVPQQTGEIIIDPFEIECFIQVQSRSNSIFDDFFGNYETVKKALKSVPVKVTVKALPAGAPKDFTGAVGEFSLESSVDKKELSANDALNYQIKISGRGNFKLIVPPTITFPADFEVYDPKLIDNYKTNEQGIYGSKTFEYLCIPRFGGSFEIPSISYSYFDPKQKKYVSLKTDAYQIEVAKSDQEDNPQMITRSSGTEVRMLGQDIRYIKTGDVALVTPNRAWSHSSWFYLLYLITLLVGGLILYGVINWQKKQADTAAIRSKKASKVGQKRLKKAKEKLKNHKKEEFLDELISAVWNYMGYKWNIDPSDYSKELITSKFDEAQISTELKDEVFDLLESGEYQRYAPGDKEEVLDTLYKRAEKIINELERSIGKRRK